MALPQLYFLLSAFFLGLGSVLAKLLLSDPNGATLGIDPIPLLTFQMLGGVGFLILVQALRRWTPVPLKQLKRPAMAGFIQGLGSIGTIMALALISASEASVVFATQPVLMLGLAWMLLGEKVAFSTICLALCAVAGVITIVAGDSGDMSSARIAGLAFAGVSTASAALYVVWMRGLSGTVEPLVALIVVQTIAFLIAALAWTSVSEFAAHPLRIGGVRIILSAIGVGVLHYGLAFWIYLLGLQKVPASIAGVYLSLVPVFAIGLAWVLLDERLTMLQWAGACAVIGAVGAMSILSARRPER